jgi:hypothetical protein
MSQFAKQFILTKVNLSLSGWKWVKIDDYSLYTHPALQYTYSSFADTELHLLGNVYDWVIPFQTNQQILDSLAKAENFEKLTEQLAHLTGQYVIIYKSNENLIVLNDACGQSEVYYDTTLSTFATQPKLIGKVIELEPYTNAEQLKFFESSEFKNKGVFFGELTHISNVKHLTPNHHINIKQGKVVRHYPTTALKPMLIDEAAGRASIMLKGYLKAIAHRDRMAMAVTGGYDSRILFLASLDLPCQYFVQKHSNMSNDHYDIAIPKQLTKLFGKEFTVIPDLPKSESVYNDDYVQSVDFPRFLPLASQTYAEHIYINGNISEVARNYFGYHKQVNAKNLAYLNGFKNNMVVIEEYRKWLSTNGMLFHNNGYHVLDMFYWEEKMGNWAAKAKTEANTLGQNLISPFNSTELLTILLCTRRSHRDSHKNKLYNRIAELMEPKAIGIPINPCRKQKVITTMKALRIYNLYRYLGVKLQLLKL